MTTHEFGGGWTAEKLDRVRKYQGFYPRRRKRTLFGDEDVREKDAGFNRIGRFFLDRLGTIFTAVARNPLVLRNSKNVPLYLLCFAAGNPKGAPTAVKIAQDILRG